MLRAGGVVALPTETVYGLAADAANDDAVRRIYAIKGRPAHHPLILHLASAAAARALALDPPPSFDRLAARFWPGPLTLVVRKGERVGALVTGGQATVALRVPAHPVAQAVLDAFGGALAAPSANRFGGVSPTTAAHVRDDLGAAVDLILDGGPAQVGLESTIVDLTAAVPAVLRRGTLTPSALSAALGAPVVAEPTGVRVPGTLPSHYAPRAALVLAADDAARDADAARRAAAGERTGVLILPADPAAAARSLYATLRALDERGYATIVATLPPADEATAALRDRLERAAAPRP